MIRIFASVCVVSSVLGQDLDGPDSRATVYQLKVRGQKGQGTGLCLDLAGGSQDNGTPIQIWDCNGSQNQLWYFPEGAWKIMLAVNNNKCIDAGPMADGTQLWLWDCNGQNQQSWGYDSDKGTLYLSNSEENGPLATKCADVAGQSLQDGTPVQVWDCNNNWNQAFEPVPGGGPGPSPGPAPGPISGAAHETIVLNGMVGGGTQDAVLTYPTGSAVPNGGYPLITFAHGTHVAPSSYQSLIDTVVKYGFVVVAVGSCPVSMCTNGWKDVKHAIDVCKDGSAKLKSGGGKVTQLDMVDFSRIGLLGHSMGGGYVTALATDGGDGIVCGASLHGAPCGSYHSMGPIVPMLYTAGSRDTIIPPSRVQSVVKTCKAKCDYQDIQGVGHFPIGAAEAKMAAEYLHGCLWGSYSTNNTVII